MDNTRQVLRVTDLYYALLVFYRLSQGLLPKTCWEAKVHTPFLVNDDDDDERRCVCVSVCVYSCPLNAVHAIDPGGFFYSLLLLLLLLLLLCRVQHYSNGGGGGHVGSRIRAHRQWHTNAAAAAPHSLLFHKLLIGRLPSSLLFLHFFLSLEPLQQLPAAADANKSLLYSMSLKQQDEKKVTSIQFLSSSSSSFWVNKRQLKGTTHHKLYQQLRVQRY